jgi:hypothetical protein
LGCDVLERQGKKSNLMKPDTFLNILRQMNADHIHNLIALVKKKDVLFGNKLQILIRLNY